MTLGDDDPGRATPRYAIAVSPDDRKAYVTRPADDAVTVLDLTTNTSTGDIALPGLSPRGIAFAPDGQTAWVVGNGLRRIGVATNTAGPGVSLAGAADAVAVSQDGMTAFVTLPGLDAIQPVGITTAGTTIPVGASPAQIALSPDGTTLYVTNRASNTVSVVNVATRVVVATIPVGNAPIGISFRTDGQRAYVAQRQRQHGLGHRHGDPHRRRLAGPGRVSGRLWRAVRHAAADRPDRRTARGAERRRPGRARLPALPAVPRRHVPASRARCRSSPRGTCRCSPRAARSTLNMHRPPGPRRHQRPRVPDRRRPRGLLEPQRRRAPTRAARSSRAASSSSTARTRRRLR